MCYVRLLCSVRIGMAILCYLGCGCKLFIIIKRDFTSICQIWTQYSRLPLYTQLHYYLLSSIVTLSMVIDVFLKANSTSTLIFLGNSSCNHMNAIIKNGAGWLVKNRFNMPIPVRMYSHMVHQAREVREGYFVSTSNTIP